MVKWSKTSPFHGGNPSSNLGRVTKEKTFERMSFLFPTEIAHKNAPAYNAANSSKNRHSGCLGKS